MPPFERELDRQDKYTVTQETICQVHSSDHQFKAFHRVLQLQKLKLGMRFRRYSYA